jgi:hypothetical protein
VSGKDGLGQHLGIVLVVSPQPYPKIGARTLNSALGSSRTAVRGSGVTLSRRRRFTLVAIQRAGTDLLMEEAELEPSASRMAENRFQSLSGVNQHRTGNPTPVLHRCLV